MMAVFNSKEKDMEYVTCSKVKKNYLKGGMVKSKYVFWTGRRVS